MTRTVIIHVEGQTEANYVNVVLRDHLRSFDIHPQPIIMSTKRLISGKKFKGGITSFEKVEPELRSLLRASHAIAVTTMYDFYALPEDFPGMQGIAIIRPHLQASYLELALSQQINNPKFIPYLQVHEFEAILFSDTKPFAEFYGAATATGIANILLGFQDNPELINNHRDTSPSHRIADLIDGYDKATDGPLLAAEIPLSVIRSKCPHFNAWITTLEGL